MQSIIKTLSVVSVATLLTLSIGCVADVDDSPEYDDLAEANQALKQSQTLAPPGSPQHDSIMIAFRADLEEDGLRWIRTTSGDGDPVAYECGASTCTCNNTADCLVMAWEKTDGPCSDTGPGTTCCINESCT